MIKCIVCKVLTLKSLLLIGPNQKIWCTRTHIFYVEWTDIYTQAVWIISKGKKSSKNIQAQKKWCVLCFWQKSWILSLGQAPRLRRQSHSEKTFKDRKSKDRDDSTGLSAQWCFPHLLKQPQGALICSWFRRPSWTKATMFPLLLCDLRPSNMCMWSKTSMHCILRKWHNCAKSSQKTLQVCSSQIITKAEFEDGCGPTHLFLSAYVTM